MDLESDEDDSGSSALVMADPGAGYALVEAVKNGRYRQAKLMLEAGSEANVRDGRSGQTPLILCCTNLPDARTRSKFVRLLLDAGADPNIGDRRATSALMHAAILGQVDTVLQLLDHPSIDLEQQDVDGNTALMYAASFGHADIVGLLLGQMGRLRQVLHLSQRNRSALTALQLAERHGHQRVVAALGGDPDAKDHDRGPTLSLPLMSSFPIRWRRQKIAGQQRRLTMDERETEETGSALPRLAWTNDAQSPAIHRRFSDEESALNDEFRKVLNLLDAAVDVDDRVLQPTPEDDDRDEVARPVARAYHFPVNGYFPPIRPLRTTALPPIAGDSQRPSGGRLARENNDARFASGPFPHPL